MNWPGDEEVGDTHWQWIRMPVCFWFTENVEIRVIYCAFLVITAPGGEQAMGSSIQKYETALWKAGNDADNFCCNMRATCQQLILYLNVSQP